MCVVEGRMANKSVCVCQHVVTFADIPQTLIEEDLCGNSSKAHTPPTTPACTHTHPHTHTHALRLPLILRLRLLHGSSEAATREAVVLPPAHPPLMPALPR